MHAWRKNTKPENGNQALFCLLPRGSPRFGYHQQKTIENLINQIIQMIRSQTPGKRQKNN
jgi:hypothetical protein